MASSIAALPRDSHVQSHAAVHKNKLCDSYALLVSESDRRWLDPDLSLANFSYRADQLRRERVSIFKRTSKRSKIDS
jgi:hypothetical protein